MKNITVLFIFSFVFFISCQEKEDQENKEETLEIEEIDSNLKTAEVSSRKEYGFNLEDYDFQRDTIQNGDSFGLIMDANGITPGQVYKINKVIEDTFDTRRINSGRPYIVVRPKGKDETVAFIYQNDNVNYTVVNIADSISASQKKLPVTIKQNTISGKITSSFAGAMAEAGATPGLIHELASLYQWEIDFFRLKKGDKFKVVYNKRFINDSIFAGIEKIDAAEFTHDGEPFYAFRFKEDDNEGFASFYDEEARSLQNFFLKAPVDYTRISSRYTKKRFHPVQKRYKAHLGTDYAAPTGTPIKSTADGVVIASSYTNGNGNYVKVKHNNKYTTQYLHMSKRKARRGDRVKQGDVIGYVGQTGLATGPHVCYRFWVNGNQEDPYKQNMPNSEPLDQSLKSEFLKSIKPLKEKLDNMKVKDKSEDRSHLAGISKT